MSRLSKLTLNAANLGEPIEGPTQEHPTGFVEWSCSTMEFRFFDWMYNQSLLYPLARMLYEGVPCLD